MGKFGIIVLENNPNDNTAKVAQKYGVKIVLVPQKGVEYARQADTKNLIQLIDCFDRRKRGPRAIPVGIYFALHFAQYLRPGQIGHLGSIVPLSTVI